MSRFPRLFALAVATSLVIGAAGCSDLTSPPDAPEIAANNSDSGV
jgi:hypothetical protein